MQALVKICSVLEEHYPIRDVVGHSAVTNRKVDPGPALEEAFKDFGIR